MRHPILSVIFIALGCGTAAAQELYRPAAVYLTWQGDPSQTITVQWISRAEDHRTDLVQYRLGGNRWHEQTGTHRAMPGDEEHVIHQTKLEYLESDARYTLRLGVDGAFFTFRTMPKRLTRPVRFAVGGDVYRNEQWFGRICEQLAERDLDFIVLGGDIAGGAGKLSNAHLWLKFLSQWTEHTTVKGSRRLIPMIPVMGNHEVANGGFHCKPEDAPFFNALFAYPGLPAYGVIDFGDYMSLLTLNSGHIHPIDGEQKQWLDKTLAERKQRTHLFAAYHVPAFPAARPYSLGSSKQIRKHWVPIFEEHGVDAAFEHHEHCFKRTQPIKNGEIDEYGVLYFGNGGCSEREGRIPAPPGDWLTGGRWYLAKSGRRNHFHLVTLDGDVRSHEAIDVTGHAFDTVHVLDGAPGPIVAPPTIFKAKQFLLWGAFAGASAVVTLATLAWIFWEIYKRVRKKPASA